jgi:hypothetical protein
MRRMNKKHLVVFALLACLTGCVPVDSLNPWFTEKDLVSDKSLTGIWVGSDNGAEGELEISLAAGEDNKEFYVLTMRDKEKDDGQCRNVSVYHARLFELSGKRFFDVVPDTVATQNSSFALQMKTGKSGTAIEPHFLKLGDASYIEFGSPAHSSNNGAEARLRTAHWIAKVSKDGDNLHLDWMDDDVFKKSVNGGKFKLAHTILGSGKDTANILITAPTKELQAFVLEHVDDRTVFSGHVDPLHRKP